MASGFNFWVGLLFTTGSSQSPKKHKELHKIRFNCWCAAIWCCGIHKPIPWFWFFFYSTERCTGIQVIRVWQIHEASTCKWHKTGKASQVVASVLILQGSSRGLLALKHTHSTSRKVKGSAPLHFLKWFCCCTDFCSHGDLFDSWSGHM